MVLRGRDDAIYAAPSHEGVNAVSVAGGLLIAFGAAGVEWAGPLLDKAAERLFDGAGGLTKSRRACGPIPAASRSTTIWNR
jgi:hypothetical protein